jgi:ASC-1-like (ASCH) protein
MKNYSLRIRPQYLQGVLDGRKTIEIRVAYPHLAKMSAGDTLTFNDQHAYQVIKVNRYPSFDALLEGEDPASIAPEISAPEALLRVMREIYPPEKEALGVLAIHISPVHGAAQPALSAPSR